MAETFELTIEKLVTGGAGLGRHDGQAVFVPLTAPGDQIRARASKTGKGFLEAELVEVVDPGPGRRAAPCPHYGVRGVQRRSPSRKPPSARRRDNASWKPRVN